MGDEIPTNEKIKEAYIQIMIGERGTAVRLLQQAITETRARRLVLQARRLARQNAGAQEPPKDQEGIYIQK